MTGDGLGQGLSDMWRSVLLFIPTALAFVAVLLVGYLIARLLRTAVTKGLRKAGLDRAVERTAANKIFSRTSSSTLGGKLVFYAVLLFALQLAFGLWGPNPVSDLLTSLIGWLPRLLVAIVLIVVAAAIARAAQDLIMAALGGLSYGRLVARAASVVIVALGVIAALDQVQIATTITQPVLIAILATIAGVLIVGVGGGLIRPMQNRWESWLERAATESATIRDHARAYATEQAERAEQAEHAARAEQAKRAEEAERAERAEQAARSSDETRPYETAIRVPAVRPQSQAERTHGPAPAKTQVISEPDDDQVPADETQVIPPPRQSDQQATVVTSAPAETTVINPGPNDTVVIGSGTEDAESTQVIPPADTATTRPLPPADDEKRA
ncbi:hypothetical protein KOI35_24150 [Actinoplanes bogorensis]|uniref:Transporter (Transmembrane protein) n=1 Tax=Paractinoplanes bogorensis TaxID=1610840 RepID=A0ABS5YT49_9ACTN|nr:hypothetical protein [Actinoplanes bogorensis]MBU2666605.1 hypothetical protein [Actinoplanes bogorensis]